MSSVRQYTCAARLASTRAIAVHVIVEIETTDGKRRASTVILPRELYKADLTAAVIDRLDCCVSSIERMESAG